MLSTSISAYLHIAYIIVYMYTVYRSILLSKSILLIRYNNSCSCSLGATRTAPLLALPLVLRQRLLPTLVHPLATVGRSAGTRYLVRLVLDVELVVVR